MQGSAEMPSPRGRASGLVVRELAEEVLVYDLQRERAFALNRIAGLVWKHCDGVVTVGTLCSTVADELGAEVSIDTVWQAISQLADDGLLEHDVPPPPARTMTRRDMMQKVGLAGSVALITSIAVPASAALAACTGTTCGGGCSTGCSAVCGGGPSVCFGPPTGTSCPHTCCSTGGNFGLDSRCGGLCCPGYTCEYHGGAGQNRRFSCEINHGRSNP